MAAFQITDFFIYRARYIIGYGIIGLLLVALLAFAGFFVPGGLSDNEIAAVVRSDAINWSNASTYTITHLPFHLLQQLSLDLFGVHNWSIKLPSLIIGLLSAIGLIVLFNQWFKQRIALIASFIAITTGQFIFVAQSGNPSIMYIFLTIWLLVFATLIARASRWKFLWRILFFVFVAMSIYTPLSIYVLIAIALTVFLHPHLRYLLRQMSKLKLIGAFILSAIILVPLVTGIIRDPSLGLTLLGIPGTLPDIPANIMVLLKQYFLFWQPSSSPLMTPVFGFGSMLLIGMGFYFLLKTRETSQSYLIIIWLLCLLPVLILNPDFTSVMFVPMVLLLALGINGLIGYWYRLFPKNPYARITALLPLAVLFGTLGFAGFDRYVHGYYYDPGTATHFSRDLRLLPRDVPNVVVSQDQQAFYQVVAHHTPAMTVSTAPNSDRFVATRDAMQSFEGYTIERIITSNRQADADRFYVYTKNDQ
ncbi:MAG: conserved rane protein of unknown function [Candidatus Saccharibacteria bacterium]|nr:conserved rane protein of unknown function [Candidatus Saccharibacteria bacterium]